MRHRVMPIPVALLLLAACADTPVDPGAALAAARAQPAERLTVMTRNMYIGADADPVLNALVFGGDVPGALGTALAQLQRTDFATRVQALADEIAAERPQIVGLQEVWTLDVIPAALGLPGSPFTVDFLPALQFMLAQRGLTYQVAAVLTSSDIDLGAVHIVDHDAVLVDPSAVTLAGPVTTTVFGTNLPLPPGTPFSVLRGYTTIPVATPVGPVLVVNTHFESGNVPGFDLLRAAQALELAQGIGAAPAVIVMGDLNEGPTSLMHGVLAGAGLTDLWAAQHPGAPGFTCCHAADLSNLLPTLDQRIDYVWTRGLDGPSGMPQGTIGRTGHLPSDRLAGAFGTIWPSDHAGLVATVLLPGPSRR